jgi:transposase
MDLTAHGKLVGVLLDRIRYQCRDCDRAFLQPLPDVDERSQMTMRLAAFIEEQSILRTFTSIADEVGVSEKTVRNLFNAYIDRLDKEVVFAAPEWMGIDEVHLLRKPRCVITNVKDRTIVGVLEERTKKAATHFLSEFPKNDLVEVVMMDVWKPYLDAVTVTMPQAAAIIDKLHVVRMANQCLEDVRKTILSRNMRNRCEKQSSIITKGMSPTSQLLDL